MNKIILPALAALALTACSGSYSSNGKPGTIDISSALDKQGEVTTSLLGSKISFIPLETNDSVLVGESWNLKVAGDKVVITNSSPVMTKDGHNANVQVFDLNTGEYVCSPGHMGQGPEDRGMTFSVYTNKKDNKIFSAAGSGGGYVVYTTDGKFAGKMPSKPGLGAILSHTDTTITLIESDINDTSREVVTYTYGQSGTLLDSCVFFAGQEDIPFNANFHGGGSLSVNSFGASGLRRTKMDIVEFVVGGNAAIMPYIHTDYVGDDIYFTQTMCDTIYRIGNQGAEPVIIFDFGENGFPYGDFNRRKPNSNEMFIINSLPSPSKVLFAFSKGWVGEDIYNHTEYFGVYDRKSGASIVGVARKGIRDDLGGFMPFNPVTTTADGKFTGVLTMEEIEDWLAEHPDAERPASLAKSTAEDNPVLVVISD